MNEPNHEITQAPAIVQLRYEPSTPSTIPRPALHRRHKIKFRHPGYPDDFEQNILLSLYAFDHSTGGLHHGTAHLACAVVAGNAWNGFFTEERDGPKLVKSSEELLLGKSYYFHVPGEDMGDSSSRREHYKYAVYPSFEHWNFPHSNLPPTWLMPSSPTSEASNEDPCTFAPPSASNLTAAILRRDNSCRVSHQRDYIERAHLCPRTEFDWFRGNAMQQYNDSQGLGDDYLLDDISNAFALRADIHCAFDDRKFIVVPKLSHWVVHFLQLTCDLGSMYHNQIITLDSGISPLFLLVRFAWAVFPLVKTFLAGPTPRLVRLRVQVDNRLAEITKTVDGEELIQLNNPARARSMSPKKRKAASVAGNSGVQAKRCRWLSFTATPSIMSPPYLDSLALGHSSTTNSSSMISPLSSTNLPKVQPKKSYMTDIKAQWIQKQRLENTTLLCCDYNAADAVVRTGAVGKRELGGAHLCVECLGAEYREESVVAENLDDENEDG